MKAVDVIAAHQSNTGRADAMEIAVLCVIAAVAIWLSVCCVAMTVLAWQIPITTQDLADASWLGSPAIMFHFSTGMMGKALVGALIVIGVAGALVRPIRVSMVAGNLACALLLLLYGNQEMALRVAVAEGTARIGCYVAEVKECRAMLGLPHDGSRSMFEQNANYQYADWYVSERSAQTNSISEIGLVLTGRFPMGWLLLAPKHVRDGERINAMLERQRLQVARMRKEASQL